MTSWLGPYPPDVAASQYEKMVKVWRQAVDEFSDMLSDIPNAKRKTAEKDLQVFKTITLHYKSIANQIRFYMLRELLTASKSSTEKRSVAKKMKSIVEEELEHSIEAYQICQKDSRIGYEASFQYYYLFGDILERIACCQYILREIIPEI